MKESGQMKRRYRIVHNYGDTYHVQYHDFKTSLFGNEKWYFALDWDGDVETFTEIGAEYWIRNNMKKRKIHEENKAKYAEPREVPPFVLIDPEEKDEEDVI